ncbi:hypothetical protein VULLAG_LOCUS12847 [Vulpes lagopus]
MDSKHTCHISANFPRCNQHFLPPPPETEGGQERPGAQGLETRFPQVPWWAGAGRPKPIGGQRCRSRLTSLPIGFPGLRPLSRAGDSVCGRQASHPPARGRTPPTAPPGLCEPAAASDCFPGIWSCLPGTGPPSPRRPGAGCGERGAAPGGDPAVRGGTTRQPASLSRFAGVCEKPTLTKFFFQLKVTLNFPAAECVGPLKVNEN